MSQTAMSARLPSAITPRVLPTQAQSLDQHGFNTTVAPALPHGGGVSQGVPEAYAAGLVHVDAAGQYVDSLVHKRQGQEEKKGPSALAATASASAALDNMLATATLITSAAIHYTVKDFTTLCMHHI